MQLSSRVSEINESVTLKLNAKAVQLADEGKKIYNLTAGQLPFRPMGEFVDLIRSESDFIKSFQYSPVPGYPELRKKIVDHFSQTRGISFEEQGLDFDCVISNGGKHCLSNIFGCIIDHGDEVILFAPYWVSYPEMIRFTRGTPIIVETSTYDLFVPSIDEIKRKISPKTKAIVINSPNNPTGTHYGEKWMQEFAELMLEYPDINIISDEIYYELYYYDPKPTYFYQYKPELLSRTIIVDGISKTLASTGLRIGYTIAPKKLTTVMAKLQGQTTSGANSLVQRALVNFDFGKIDVYLKPIKKHLRENAEVLGEVFRKNNLAHSWYQPLSAFYYLFDFTQTPCMQRYKKDENDRTDYSTQICEDILEECGIAIVPGEAFGLANTARLSLVLEKEPFTEAIEILFKFILKRI